LAVQRDRRELVIGLSPLGRPAARVVAAVCRAGGLGVLDLAGGDGRVREALALTEQWSPGSYGVRVPQGCRLEPAGLPVGVNTVVLGRNSPWRPSDLDGYRVLSRQAQAVRLPAGQDVFLAKHPGVPARALPRTAAPVPRRRRPQVRVRGFGVWRACRPAQAVPLPASVTTRSPSPPLDSPRFPGSSVTAFTSRRGCRLRRRGRRSRSDAAATT
jgi:hypothetical protein